MPRKEPKAKTKKSAPAPEAAPKPKKASFTAAELRVYQEELRVRKHVLMGDVSSLESEGLRKAQDASGNLSSLPVHLADLGSDAFDQETTLGRMESESDELQEIEEALERIRDGSFGLCENCSKAIPKLRLKAIPYTRLCVACKSKEERG